MNLPAGPRSNVDNSPTFPKRPSRLESTWSWLFNLAMLALVIGVALNFDRVMVRARFAPDGSLFSSGGGLILAVSLAFLLTAAVHEAGHLATARMARLRFRELVVGPLTVTQTGDGLRLGIQRTLGLFSGRVTCIPETSQSPATLNRPLLLFATGGPLASILLAAAGLLLFRLLGDAPTNAAPAWPVEFALLVGIISFFFFLGAMRPGTYTSGLPADGSRIMTLWRGGPAANRWCALVALQGANQTGQRPRDWPSVVVEQALEPDNGSFDDLAAQLLGYYWAMDTDQTERAGNLVKAAWESPIAWSSGARSQMALELAFWEAFANDKPAAAREWLAFIRRPHRASALFNRTMAAIYQAEGDPVAAAQAAQTALAALANQEQTATVQLEREWLQSIIEAANLPEPSNKESTHDH